MNLKQKLNKWRWKEFKGYRFDKLIFNVAFYVILAFLFWCCVSVNFDFYYFSCPEKAGSLQGQKFALNGITLDDNLPGLCKNPFYKPFSWRNQEYLTPGEYGTRPGVLFTEAPMISFIILIIAFLINHLIYNRKFSENVENKD